MSNIWYNNSWNNLFYLIINQIYNLDILIQDNWINFDTNYYTPNLQTIYYLLNEIKGSGLVEIIFK